MIICNTSCSFVPLILVIRRTILFLSFSFFNTSCGYFKINSDYRFSNFCMFYIIVGANIASQYDYFIALYILGINKVKFFE